MSFGPRMLRAQGGMTVVEVMVAAMILVIGSLALLSLVDAGARNTFRAEQSQVVSNRLQSELETIRELPYDQVAMTGVPIPSGDPDDPAWRVSGSSYAVNRAGTDLKPLVTNGSALEDGGTVAGGTISASPEPFESGDVSGAVYRYVVWEDDPSCPSSHCPGNQDLKRVIIAVSLDQTASGGTRGYQELQGQIVDPEVEPVENANPIDPSEETAQPWTYFLTDTPCDQATRQPILADHLMHNTRGTCDAGLKNGNNPGAPDLMFTEPPPFDPESPTFDYATDVEPVENPESDRGLQLLEGLDPGCQSYALEIPGSPDPGDPHRFKRVHKWVSPPMPSGFDIELDGEATLNLWTQTVGAASYPGEICVWLFVREANLLGVPVDTPAVNLDPPLTNATYFSYRESQWPTSWTEITLSMNFLLDAHLLPGSRLGLAIAVEKEGTGVGETETGLQFHYDEPSFDSRLEVKTHSDLPDFSP